MKTKNVLATAAILSLAAMAAGAAHAQALTATLSATYYEVAAGSDLDYGHFSTPNLTLGSTLGPNGLPVATTPYGVNDVDPATGEIEWWSPALDSNVVYTGRGTITLPYDSDMYAPNSTGGDDTFDFETAVFKGVFDLASSGTVSFTLGSDDDSFLYVDGVLIGQNPGVHSVSSVEFTSGTLQAGPHTLEVFYADRDVTGAHLSLSSDSNIGISGAPEPATWAMLIVGLAGLGAAVRRMRSAFAAA